MPLVRAAGYAVSNVDCVLIAEQPKFGPHAPTIRRRLAELLGVPPGDVNVKAKTAEGTGAIGAGEAIAAHAAVLLKPAAGVND
jgi:2-C-methyl-D-erythritol 2,4-cyclodiphosphate synthase